MTDIAPPKAPEDAADFVMDCEFAIEPAFQDLARQAEAVGWSEDAVAAALLSLAGNHIKGIIADRKTLADMNAALHRGSQTTKAAGIPKDTGG